MTPVGLATVTARIADLQQRFAPPPAFSMGAGAGGAGAGTAADRAAPLSGAPFGAAPVLGPPSGTGTSATPAPGSFAGGGSLTFASAAPGAVFGAGSLAGAGLPTSASPGPMVHRTGAATGAWAARLPAAGAAWAPAIERAASAAGVDPPLLAALVQQESGFRPDARSHAGAIGLGQLMPGTARGLGVDPTDPEQNLAGAARYLKEQLDRFGSVDLALAAYNAGPGRVARAGGIPNIAETQHYVRTVTSTYDRLRAA